MFIRHPGLGLIPAWQFSMDPNQNPKLNPFVAYPPGMTQQTIQPVGPYYVGANGSVTPGIAGSLLGGGGLLGLAAVAIGAVLLGVVYFRR